MFFLIRPVGLQCQLSCRYCYYKDGHADMRQLSANKMPIDVIRVLLEGLPALPGEHTLCLHGGEPLLIGKRWVRECLDLVTAYNTRHAGLSSVSLALQTNAMLIDRDWVELLTAGNVGVSVSLDGPTELHDSARVNRRAAGTHAQVVAAIHLLADAGIRVGGLAVVTARTAESTTAAFYDYFRTIPLLNGLDVNPYIETGETPLELAAKDVYEAEPQELLRFLCELFDLWLFDGDIAKRVEIRMFEQLVGVALGFVPSLCNLMQGASCGRTPSIMPNGEVYACDLDVSGLDFRMGDLSEDSIADICSSARLQDLHTKIRLGMERRGCTTCSLLPYCGLTCPRHVFSHRDHSAYCRMMEEIVRHAKEALDGIAKRAFAESIDFSDKIHPLVAEDVSQVRVSPTTHGSPVPSPVQEAV
jgi:radical SAM protein with 4Fe4S-binding SPASM domain